jgi:hypothetical protein
MGEVPGTTIAGIALVTFMVIAGVFVCTCFYAKCHCTTAMRACRSRHTDVFFVSSDNGAQEEDGDTPAQSLSCAIPAMGCSNGEQEGRDIDAGVRRGCKHEGASAGVAVISYQSPKSIPRKMKPDVHLFTAEKLREPQLAPPLLSARKRYAHTPLEGGEVAASVVTTTATPPNATAAAAAATVPHAEKAPAGPLQLTRSPPLARNRAAMMRQALDASRVAAPTEPPAQGAGSALGGSRSVVIDSSGSGRQGSGLDGGGSGVSVGRNGSGSRRGSGLDGVGDGTTTTRSSSTSNSSNSCDGGIRGRGTGERDSAAAARPRPPPLLFARPASPPPPRRSPRPPYEPRMQGPLSLVQEALARARALAASELESAAAREEAEALAR